jgi:hypothetical protein
MQTLWIDIVDCCNPLTCLTQKCYHIYGSRNKNSIGNRRKSVWRERENIPEGKLRPELEEDEEDEEGRRGFCCCDCEGVLLLLMKLEIRGE